MNMRITTELGFTPKEIKKYFDGVPKWPVYFSSFIALVITYYSFSLTLFANIGWDLISGMIIGLICYALLMNLLKSKIKDREIDKMWQKIAKEREDEAYRAVNYHKEDAIRDAIYVYGLTKHESPNTEIKGIIGKDEYYRINHQRLIYIIFGRDQLIVWQESICLESLWDSPDVTEEYFWNDVSAVKFDEDEHLLQLVIGPIIEEYPLVGDRGSDVQAQDVANAVRMILRERKVSA